MAPKANLFKRAAFILKEPKIQLGLEIKDNNNIIDMCK